MSGPIFEHAAFDRLIEDFSAQVSRCLLSSPSVARFATGVENLKERNDSPFQVAVTGQMRCGKSTLLNALMGKELAITGVDETTATINKFTHSESNMGLFRVHWKGGRQHEDFPIERIKDWLGKSDLAAETAWLEFFSDSAYLKTASVVDTPGTRSTIDSHTEAVTGFIVDEDAAERLQTKSMDESGKADAIVYVFPPVARETDEDFLAKFDSDSRVPDSSPYNSIAVLHKWDASYSPSEAQAMADKLATRMKTSVSTVIPVSAPLAIAVQRFSSWFWQDVLTLAKSSPEDLKTLLRKDTYFCSETDDSLGVTPSLPREERLRMLNHTREECQFYPWPSFRLIITTAANGSYSTIEELKSDIQRMSGIDILSSELKRRFFDRAGTIKKFSILGKAWGPCTRAQLTLRNRKSELSDMLRKSALALSQVGKSSSMEDAREFISYSKENLERELHSVREALSGLESWMQSVKEVHEQMERDVEMTEHLDKMALSDADREILAYLFGNHGSSAKERTGIFLVENAQLMEDKLLAAIDKFRDASGRAKKIDRDVFDHAVSRLEELIVTLENEGH